MKISYPTWTDWWGPLSAKAPVWQPSRGRLTFSSGAEAFAYSAEDPDSLRGPQFDLAWCDELGAWARGEAVWDMLQMALRLGSNPRCVATTMPRPVPLRLALMDAPVQTWSFQFPPHSPN